MKILKKLAAFLLIFRLAGANAAALSSEEIEAPSAILMEAQTGKILFEKSPHEKRASASLTKIMSLLLIMEAVKSRKISMQDMVSTSERAAVMGGAHVWLRSGESMSVRDLIKSTAVASANDATVALAEHHSGSERAFVLAMNARAEALGMHETVFKNCNGLDEEGHVTSTYDIAVMSKELLKYPEVLEFTSTWIDYLREGKTQLVNTNRLLKTYKGASGLKTGTTSEAGSCISATAERDNLKLVGVVLGCKSGQERFKDASALLDFGFANYAMVKPKELPKQDLPEIKVRNGMQQTVSAKVELLGDVLVPKGKEKEVKSELQISEGVEAPVQAGQNLGKMIYSMEEEVLAEYPLVATEDVPKIDFSSVLRVLFENLFSL